MSQEKNNIPNPEQQTQAKPIEKDKNTANSSSLFNQNSEQLKGKNIPDFSRQKKITLMKKDKINSPDFTLKKKIRSDKFLYYYEVEEIQTGKNYFAKILRRNKGGNNETYEILQSKILNDVNILRQLKYPSIIKYIGYSPNGFDQKHQPGILMSYAENGTLNEVINSFKDQSKQTGWNDTKKLINIYGIASAISYLHRYNVLHRNLNPMNIYEDKNYHPLVSNFENACILEDNNQTYTDIGNTIGYVMYIAPEVLNKQEYSRSSDIYSFGMIIYEIMTNSIPFEGMQPEELKNDILQGKRPEISNTVPEAYKELINKCWSQNISERPNIETILNTLITDKRLITNNVDEAEYKSYIKYIEDYYLIQQQEEEEEDDEDILDEILFNSPVKVKRKTFNNLKMMKKLKKDELISQENFYEIYKTKPNDSNQIHLARIFYITMKYYNEDERNKINSCIKSILEADHPSILKSIEFSNFGFGREYRPTLITEYVRNITLQDIITKGIGNSIGNKWNLTKKLINIYGIACGMSYLHKHNVLHLDLTPNNIILDSNLYPKIKDFGFRGVFKNLDNVLKIRKQSLFYPPEFYNKNEYTKSSDVYSFALIVYSILMNEIPFNNVCIADHLQNLNKNERPLIKDDVPKVYRDLIEKCWSNDPEQRPSFSKIVEELESNKEFITKDVDESDFKYYVEYANSRIPDDNQEAKTETKTGDTQKEEQKTKTNDDNKTGDTQKEEQKTKTNDDNKTGDTQNQEQEQKVKPSPGNPNDNKEEEEEEEDYDDDDDYEDISETDFYVDRVILDFYTQKELIGRGNTSNVYRSSKRGSSRRSYAAKIFCTELQKQPKNQSMSPTLVRITKNLSREVNLHASFVHPLITKFIGFSPRNFDNRKNPVLMLEFVENGTLKDLIENLKNGKKVEGWNDTNRLINIYGIATSMAYLHSQDILYRDLKPSDILLDKEFHPKLTDFGLSVKETDLSIDNENEPVGTVPYIAPEIWRGSKYSKKSDIYSFGILLYELMMNDFAFQNKLDSQIILNVSVKKERPPFIKEIPQTYKDLIESCWNDEAENRPVSFDKILDDLKSNKGFITQSVDEKIYRDYINGIDEKLRRLQIIAENK